MAPCKHVRTGTPCCFVTAGATKDKIIQIVLRNTRQSGFCSFSGRRLGEGGTVTPTTSRDIAVQLALSWVCYCCFLVRVVESMFKTAAAMLFNMATVALNLRIYGRCSPFNLSPLSSCSCLVLRTNDTFVIVVQFFSYFVTLPLHLQSVRTYL